eukprot:4974265-Pyramimonas_sp.AAC.1
MTRCVLCAAYGMLRAVRPYSVRCTVYRVRCIAYTVCAAWCVVFVIARCDKYGTWSDAYGTLRHAPQGPPTARSAGSASSSATTPRLVPNIGGFDAQSPYAEAKHT